MMVQQRRLTSSWSRSSRSSSPLILRVRKTTTTTISTRNWVGTCMIILVAFLFTHEEGPFSDLHQHQHQQQWISTPWCVSAFVTKPLHYSTTGIPSKRLTDRIRRSSRIQVRAVDKSLDTSWKSLTQKISTTATPTTTTTTTSTSTPSSSSTNGMMDVFAGSTSVSPQQLQQQLQDQLGDVSNKIHNSFDTIWHADLPILSNIPTTITENDGFNLVLPTDDTTTMIAMSLVVLVLLGPPIVRYFTESPPTSSSTSTSSTTTSSASSSPYPMGVYDPDTARTYFSVRPWMVVQRGWTVFSTATSFLALLLVDKLTGKFDTNAPQRSVQLATILSELGPAFIKVGQSLSIRSDILSPDYMRGLATLQDKVEPFETKEAMEILEREWGAPITDIVEYFPSEPVAAASLGQVYKVTLKQPVIEEVVVEANNDDTDSLDAVMDDNSLASSSSTTTTKTTEIREVAVKVQRPNIQTQIALDMYLVRQVGGVIKSLFNVNTDVIDLVDTWAKGFVDELDYRQEANNGLNFQTMVQSTPLKDVVFTPLAVQQLTTDKVLVTQWIDGVRLDQCSSDDVTSLCSVCMNTYLTMMLEFGTLHCDPHPGNLLRCNDGRLAILDFGMVTVIDNSIQRTLIEHMAHLTSGDYKEVPRDLYLLGFIPEDKEQEVMDEGVVDVLADVYGAWTGGGGLNAINANEVFASLQDLSGSKGNLFQIPSYFAYIAKSFSVLEGIGLSNDPQYSIVNECLPYVSNRLLTDTQSMGPALSTFIFGPDKTDIERRLVDYDRVEQLVRGFGSFASSAASTATTTGEAMQGQAMATATRQDSASLVSTSGLAASGSSSGLDVEALDQLADQVLDVVLSEEETPLQEIMIEQLAKIVAASSRTFWTQARQQSGVLPSGRSVLGMAVDPLGIFRSSRLVNSNSMDEQTLLVTSKLVDLFRTELGNSGNDDLTSLSRQDLATVSFLLSRKIFARRAVLARSSNRFFKQLFANMASRIDTE